MRRVYEDVMYEKGNNKKFISNEKKAVFKEIKEWTFCVAVSLELFMGIIHHAGYKLPYSRFILWLILLVYFFMTIGQNYTRKELFFIALAEIIGCLLYVNSGINSGIKLPIFILACKDANKERMLKCLLLIMSVTVSIIIVLNLIWGIGDSVMYDGRAYRGINGIRRLFGFKSTNVCQFMLTMILLLICVLYNESLKTYMRIGMVFINGIFGIFTASMTGSILGFFAIFMYWLIRNWKKKGLETYIFGLQCCLFVSMLTVSLICAFGVENQGIHWLNHILSERPNQIKMANSGENYAIGLVDSWKLFSSQWNKNYYDMGYVQIFYYYGIIPAVSYLVFVIYGFVKAWKAKNHKLQMAILICSIYMFMESLFFNNFLIMNLLVVYVTIAIWNRKKS